MFRVSWERVVFLLQLSRSIYWIENCYFHYYLEVQYRLKVGIACSKRNNPMYRKVKGALYDL